MDELPGNRYLREMVIEETIRGGPTYYRPARVTFSRSPEEAYADQLTALTRREREVLSLIATGLSNSQIAQILSISRHTVHAHLYSIYSKLGVGTRTAAARIAFEVGL
ncbi:MAG TPA: response regulator transcription factor [Chloroflexia bacterium]|nr:response regulator transcription factor [Chloroflexia bacterium]